MSRSPDVDCGPSLRSVRDFGPHALGANGCIQKSSGRASRGGGLSSFYVGKSKSFCSLSSLQKGEHVSLQILISKNSKRECYNCLAFIQKWLRSPINRGVPRQSVALLSELR